MKSLVQAWDWLFEFLKLLISIIFTQNFKLVWFKTKFNSIPITHNRNPPPPPSCPKCVICLLN